MNNPVDPAASAPYTRPGFRVDRPARPARLIPGPDPGPDGPVAHIASVEDN
jgi:hypothetical protein